MYNWSVDTKRLEKNPEASDKFQLEQAINFGLNQQKLSAAKLKQHWHQLHLDPAKKTYLASLLWPQKSSPPPKHKS